MIGIADDIEISVAIGGACKEVSQDALTTRLVTLLLPSDRTDPECRPLMMPTRSTRTRGGPQNNLGAGDGRGTAGDCTDARFVGRGGSFNEYTYLLLSTQSVTFLHGRVICTTWRDFIKRTVKERRCIWQHRHWHSARDHLTVPPSAWTLGLASLHRLSPCHPTKWKLAVAK